MRTLLTLLIYTMIVLPAKGANGAETSDDFARNAAEFYAAYVAAFDAERAFRDLEEQVEIGPRHPGSAGAEAMRAWLAGKLDEIGLDHWEQEFTARSVLAGREDWGYNVVAALPSPTFDPADADARWIALTCHWDSRLYADRDPDPALRREPVPAANDGASGVAALLEIARALREVGAPPGVNVLFVFYDFEDQGGTREEDFALGSAFFADNIPTTTTLLGAVNLDMVGDATQEFLLERNSLKYAREWTEAYWTHGLALFPDHFTRRRQNFVYDDHIALNRRGIPAVDLIDFDFPPWHTTADLPNACSAESLGVAGLVTLSFLAHDARPLSP